MGYYLLKERFLVAFTILFCLFFCSNFALGQNLKDIRISSDENKTRIVFDLDKLANYQGFFLQDPDRFVVDFDDTKFALDQVDFTLGDHIKSVRTNSNIDSNKLRIVFDLVDEFKIVNQFKLEPNIENENYRIAFDVGLKNLQIIEEKTISDILLKEKIVDDKEPVFNQRPTHIVTKNKITPKFKPKLNVLNQEQINITIDKILDDVLTNQEVQIIKSQKENIRKTINKNIQIKAKSQKKIIVIDAGHGGKDPGAIGRSYKTKEKYITLKYAQALKKALQKNSNYKVYLTRKNDTFIGLSRRVAISRKLNADLFISIHADSALNRKARGLSIYTLSTNASDKEAARLARSHNQGDLINDVKFDSDNAYILNTLIDLSTRKNMNNSANFAEALIKRLKQDLRLVQNSHRFAGFRVLTAPDVASVLVELGYLSNKSDEKLLKSTRYQNKVINGIVDAVDIYFKK